MTQSDQAAELLDDGPSDRRERPVVRRAARTALGALALALFALPFVAAAEWELYHHYVSRQVAAPVTRLDSVQQAAVDRAGSELAQRAAPVVLAYHDIGPSSSRYAVSAREFDRQLTAIQRCGYQSLTADQFLAYLRGGPVPPRSVLLTFDDGPDGLWREADPVLARHRMHGTVFLIASRVDHRPYYLSWREIARMADSGRWDFQDHTYDLHHRAPVDASGDAGSALADRLWLPAAHRLETADEYRARVETDLDRSLASFAAHGLPRPQLFAFPFSEATQQDDRSPATPPGDRLGAMLRSRFVATMTNVSRRPLPASRRAAGAGQVQRLEVTRATTIAQLVEGLAAWTQSPLDDADPLGRAALWTAEDSTESPGVGRFTGADPHPSGHYAAAGYRPFGSVDWDDYTVDARITRLSDGADQAGVAVREGSRDPVTVMLSATRLVMTDRRGILVDANVPISPTSAHMLQVTVRGPVTEAYVDGALTGRVTAPPPDAAAVAAARWTASPATDAAGGSAADLTGGIGLRAGVKDPNSPWPAFQSLRIHALPPAADPPSGLSPTATEAALSAEPVTVPFRPGIRP